ncbi:hypothetical protein FA15DRAFT_672401 [Coprinopsis marcescibilis]|uniref:Uncharacterized protein n=1 Tax=Coprinopsis marcescibilis TaxID=230819 RepID=A0A5C3KP28_COPMA|nr:hypothetical protein FA15DRAFT_672401 [Coprinopsis marcescibilis]
MDAFHVHTTPAELGLSHSRLYLDILELILHEHRNDSSTLSTCALVSHTMLHISRKLMYRSISLDYCENPYAYDQHRLLRQSLASHPHLCRYIRVLRLSLPSESDPLLNTIMDDLTSLERIHVIGHGLYPMHPPPPPLISHNAAGGWQATGESLKRVLKMQSLRWVTLENTLPSPFSEAYVASSFNHHLKHLEILSSVMYANKAAASTPGLDPSSADTHGYNDLAGHSTDLTNDIPHIPNSGVQQQEQQHNQATMEMGVTGTGTQQHGHPTTSTAYPSGQVDPLLLPPLQYRAGTVNISCTGNRPVKHDMVYLETLRLDLDRLRPIMDALTAMNLETCIPHHHHDSAYSSTSSEPITLLDFSHLKQAHLCVWNPDDGDAIWALLTCARESLEQLTLRYFHFHSPHAARATLREGFPSLRSVTLGIDAFSLREDPFRGLIEFFSNSAVTFPSLKTIKIQFNLWNCEANGTSWRDLCAYRGWSELDERIGTLPRDTAVVFQMECSSRYKEDEEGRLLFTSIRNELYNLRNNPSFTIL